MKILLLFLLLNHSKPAGQTMASPPPYFIAMEYKGLSNCIYKVFVSDSLILCARVNGYISVEPNFGLATSVPKSQMHRPEAYVNKQMAAKYDLLLTDIAGFLHADRFNFIIRKKDIIKMFNNPNSKWGMAYYPYGGRIIIQCAKSAYNNARQREFILVGDQNPDDVLKMLGQ